MTRRVCPCGNLLVAYYETHYCRDCMGAEDAPPSPSEEDYADHHP